jgi:ABC-type multidrug transport system fused ATPase/permease subunit
MERFDRIIVLSKGRIAEQGTHRELLERGSALYTELLTEGEQRPSLRVRGVS